MTGSASLERRPLGGKYDPPVSIKEGATYTDARIDAMTTYQYRLHAEAPGSPVSNEVTVGPPPAGYTRPLPTPKAFTDKEANASFAHSTSMELDANGDPAFLYSVIDPQFTGSKDVELWFLHWNRALWRWQEPVKITTFVGYRDGLTLAHDPGSSTWATVAESDNKIELFVSNDDGATWSVKHRMSQPDTQILGRAIALFGGRIYWLHGFGSEGLFLLSGNLSEQPSAWKKEKLPLPEPYYAGTPAQSLSIAVDSLGRPGMTYFGYGPDYNVTALYWRPGMAAPQKVQDSDGVQNDFHTADVIYSGAPKDQAKFLVELNRKKTGDVDPEIWVVRDAGSRMEIAPKIPTDGGNHSLNAPFSLAVDANGQAAVLVGRNGGTGDDKCGSPKLARGALAGPWKTCSPDSRKDTQAGGLGYGLSLRYAVNNKLYAGFSSSDAGLGPGLVLWREP